MISLIYFISILLACVLGAVVGLGGGVFIRPIFDAIGYHDVLEISFYASSAILTMAVVSTVTRLKDGTKIRVPLALSIAAGAVAGGVLGNILLEHFVASMDSQRNVQMIQIVATVAVLCVSLALTLNNKKRYEVKSKIVPPLMGLTLGITGAFLGMGGGPINVPIFMIFFGMPIKTATAYSIIIIFCTHASRLVTMGVTQGLGYFDLSYIPVVLIAAAAGGLIGAKLSKIFSEKTVKVLFMAAITGVILLNIFNGIFII